MVDAVYRHHTTEQQQYTRQQQEHIVILLSYLRQGLLFLFRHQDIIDITDENMHRLPSGWRCCYSRYKCPFPVVLLYSFL
uniref:hypothetical protein n=1 Tax=Candidatus Electrothrix sp. TaxID=2170559 RepID=UPI004055BE78